MAKFLKTIDAGVLQVVALYDKADAREPQAVRAAKKKNSSAAQRRMNQIYSYQKLELMLATNFPTPGSGLVVTLTYDDKHMPASRKKAQLRFKYFLGKLRKAREEAGLPEPVVFWCPEILTSSSGRWHHHMVIDATGNDIEMIRRCWIYASEIEVEPIRVDAEKNHETLARYMTKELRECQEYEAKPGLHGWSCTRNARKPLTDKVTVPDDYRLEPPAECTILSDERKATEWASYHIIKYRYDPAGYTKKPRAIRRRKRGPAFY